MNNDLISRRKLDGMRLVTIGFVDVKPDKRTQGWNECIDYIQKNAPTVDAEPVRHGRWITKHDILGNELDVCSACGEEAVGYDTHMGDYVTVATDFCPNCGAKMDLEETR